MDLCAFPYKNFLNKFTIMKKLSFKILLLFVAGIFSLTTATGQIMPPVQDKVAVYPTNPSPKDSIYITYSYVSDDGCPDFILEKDSVVANKIYVGKKTINNSTRICTTVISKFTAKLNLGLLAENTQLYFDGILTNTIHYDCIMDKLGVVVAFKDNSTLIKDSLTADIYAIKDVKLEIGTMVKFKGVKIECFTTPCYNIVNCYEVISKPPTPCVMDKVGVVVEGIDGCAGQLFINETSIIGIPQLYSIENNYVSTSNSPIPVGLKVGDNVKFGGYLIKNDSNRIGLCNTVGVATCYEVINSTPPCVMDKVGIVVEGVDACAGQIFIQELSPISSTRQLYIIKEIIISNNSTFSNGLNIGDEVKFGGYLTKNDSNTNISCRTVGVATCYEVINSTPPCVMDKTGVVVEGIDACAGQLFIEDTSYPGMSMIRQLYAIEKNVAGTGTTTPDSGSVSTGTVIYPIGLKVGDKVQFGGYLIKNDSSQTNLCHIVGVATCYNVIEIPPTPCIMDKTGMIVPGIDGCTGQLFIQEYSPISSARQLYIIKDIPILNSNGTTFTGLKAGDKVKFGGYLTKNDSTTSILCYTVGVATCYEVINPVISYKLAGSVMAENELIKSGYAVLFKKGFYKAIASGAITDGTFEFTNLPKADYTVYAIPGLSLYKNYLPTFYINKLRFKFADYLTLNDSSNNMVVHLRKFVRTTGTGRISGNIFFETFNLKDSILTVNGSTNSYPSNTIAMNTPVVLYNSTNEPVAWTVTDMAGFYVFENIALDTYKVVSETAAAIGESNVVLSDNNSAANADLLLKNQQTDTGIENIENGVINTYPNPVIDYLNIEVKDASTIKIYNVIGKMLFNENLNSGLNTLDLSTIREGVYIAKIGKITQRIVKK